MRQHAASSRSVRSAPRTGPTSSRNFALEFVVVQRGRRRTAVAAHLGGQRPARGQREFYVGVLLSKRRVGDDLHPVAQFDHVGPGQHVVGQLVGARPAGIPPPRPHSGAG